jgi:hypothetical protein
MHFRHPIPDEPQNFVKLATRWTSMNYDMTLDVDIFWCWRDADLWSCILYAKGQEEQGKRPVAPLSHALIAALKLTSLVVHVTEALRKENTQLKLKNTHTQIYIYMYI